MNRNTSDLKGGDLVAYRRRRRIRRSNRRRRSFRGRGRAMRIGYRM